MEQRAIAKVGEAEKVAHSWLSTRAKLRSLLERVRETQESLRALEQSNPWLGSLKGTLRKKDGRSFPLPNGTRPTREPARSTTPPPSSSGTGDPPPSRLRTESARKRKTGPLMEKYLAELAEKRKRLSMPATKSPMPAVVKPRRNVVEPSELPLEELKRLVREREDSLQTHSWEAGSEGGSRGAMEI